MGNSFRQCAAWLHTWTGLVAGWVLFFVFVTGTAGYFQHEITRWMQPETPYLAPRPLAPGDSVRMAALAVARLQQTAPQAVRWTITLPHASPVSRAWSALSIRWEDMPQAGQRRESGGSLRLDPVSGDALAADPAPRATAGGAALYRMHYELRYLPKIWGIRVVGVCTMLMLIALLTGVITHKKIFRDFFTFRPRKGQRSWMDAHNAVSVMALPFFLVITYSGLVFFMYEYMPAGMRAIYTAQSGGEEAYYRELWGANPPARAPLSVAALDIEPMVAAAEAAWGAGDLASITVEHPQGGPQAVTIARAQHGGVMFWRTDRLRFDADSGVLLPGAQEYGGAAGQTQKALINLHEGLFADAWGRALYGFAGLLGCAMIGTGLVLWTVKRRKHHLGSGREAAETWGVRIVESLNAAALAGLPLGIAAYFWANRLLPLALPERAAWEVHTLFAVWLASLFYTLARPLGRAWIELLWATAAAYACVPLINAITTDQHLLNTWLRGDGSRAGVDIGMLGMAALYAVMAVRVSRKVRTAAPPPGASAPRRPAPQGDSA